jgi:uncharacterized protein
VSGAVTIDWHGERLTLRADRAVHWAAAGAVLLADPHFGKAAAFRAAGVPVPHGTTGETLRRLAALLDATRPERLFILGDFFHAAAGRAPATLQAIAGWRAAHAGLDVVLVRGNHDVRAGPPPPEWRIATVAEPFSVGPFELRHVPGVGDGAPPSLAGHVHPVVRLADGTGASLRAPCFLFGGSHALLPAFGAFTGGARVTPAAGDRVFAVGEDAVVEVPPARARTGRRRR